MKGIVSFDIDMTLLDHKTWMIPESALEAIDRLRGNYWIVVSTGRDMDAGFSADLKQILKPDAIIHMNGTKITVGDQIIYSHLFDKRLLKNLLQYVEQGNHSIGASIEGVDYFINPELVTRHDMDLWGKTFRKFEDPWKLMELDVRTAAYIGDETGAKELEERFPEVRLFLFSGKRGADVVEVCASKAMGLKKLCSYYGVELSQTAAFGDSMNDYDIIKLAGTGVAMGNAMEELKMVADFVTDDVDQDGIWKACRRLHLI